MTFPDHFSDRYEAFRPTYPETLFAYLASLVPSHDLAWDCATGNGQAALGLTPHFDAVVATDASPQQIAQARPHPKVRPPDLETRRIEGCRSYLLAETGVWEILVGADKTA